VQCILAGNARCSHLTRPGPKNHLLRLAVWSCRLAAARSTAAELSVMAAHWLLLRRSGVALPDGRLAGGVSGSLWTMHPWPPWPDQSDRRAMVDRVAVTLTSPFQGQASAAIRRSSSVG
jgi:hypothetical protein